MLLLTVCGFFKIRLPTNIEGWRSHLQMLPNSDSQTSNGLFFKSFLTILAGPVRKEVFCCAFRGLKLKKK